MIVLSILIPSIPSRYGILSKLATELYRQKLYMQTVHPTLGEIEIVIDGSERFLDGGLSIGKKREKLVNAANGKYLCFLDDDESIAPNYMELLVRMCNENKDVCTFWSIAKLDNYWGLVDMSLAYPDNEELSANRIARRRAWHISPVRSKFAKLHTFDDINYGEDWKWFEQVLKHCETEAHSTAILHQYNHSAQTSEADKITNYVQSES
jgi:glycosyltransferase involved in cell wall biosynthesis